jgi:hypothetical protein
MISYDSKILPTSIGNTRGALGAYTKTQRFPFSHGFMFILMIFLFIRCKWSEWELGPFHHMDPNTYTISSYAPIQSQHVYFYGCHIWHQRCEVPPIHIDGVFFIAHGCQLLGLSWINKHVKTWWNGWMPYRQSYSRICHIGNHHVSLWMMLHRNFEHYGKLYIDLFFCCIILCFGITLAWGFQNIFIIHGKHTNVRCTMAGMCGVQIMSQFFFVHGMCWKHETCAPWKKSGI